MSNRYKFTVPGIQENQNQYFDRLHRTLLEGKNQISKEILNIAAHTLVYSVAKVKLLSPLWLSSSGTSLARVQSTTDLGSQGHLQRIAKGNETCPFSYYVGGLILPNFSRKRLLSRGPFNHYVTKEGWQFSLTLSVYVLKMSLRR